MCGKGFGKILSFGSVWFRVVSIRGVHMLLLVTCQMFESCVDVGQLVICVGKLLEFIT